MTRIIPVMLILLIGLASPLDAKSKKKNRYQSSNPTYTAIVIDAHSGKVLHNENADVQTYPASLTKMMTLYLLFEALENGKVSSHHKFRVSVNASRQSP